MYVNLNHPYFHDDHPIVLDEMVYKDLLHSIDPRDLPHKNYEPLIKYVKYVGCDDNIFKFYVPSPTPENYPEFPAMNLWNCYIQVMELDDLIADTSLNAVEASRLALYGGNLRIFCHCPAYIYWGMQYIDTQLGIAIVPEPRFPSIRNPHLKGIACKHLRRAIKTWGFHLGDVASEIKRRRNR